MPLSAFNMGCNIFGIQKNNHQYGLCVAWAQMLDYDVISLLIGESSITGYMLEKNDIVGVSALSSKQAAIASVFGEHHSDVYDKFQNVSYQIDGSAILIDKAKVTMKCQILDILHFSFSPNDSFVVLKILSSNDNSKLKFLSLADL